MTIKNAPILYLSFIAAIAFAIAATIAARRRQPKAALLVDSTTNPPPTTFVPTRKVQAIFATIVVLGTLVSFIAPGKASAIDSDGDGIDDSVECGATPTPLLWSNLTYVSGARPALMNVDLVNDTGTVYATALFDHYGLLTGGVPVYNGSFQDAYLQTDVTGSTHVATAGALTEEHSGGTGTATGGSVMNLTITPLPGQELPAGHITFTGRSYTYPTSYNNYENIKISGNSNLKSATLTADFFNGSDFFDDDVTDPVTELTLGQTYPLSGPPLQTGNIYQDDAPAFLIDLAWDAVPAGETLEIVIHKTGTTGDSTFNSETHDYVLQADAPCIDTDGDGTPDYLDTDSDNDGNPDGTDPHVLAPTAQPDTSDIPSTGPTTVDIVGNDDYLPATGITLTQKGGTAGGTVSFDPTTGEMTYTPLPSEAGTSVTVDYEVCFNSVCAQATVTLNVAANPTTTAAPTTTTAGPTTTTAAPTTTTMAPTTTTTVAPTTTTTAAPATAANDTADIANSGPTVIDIIGNDGFNPADGITLSQMGGTAGGTVSFNDTTGELTYTPLPSEAGQSVTVIYQVCSGSTCDTATVTLNVAADTTTTTMAPTTTTMAPTTTTAAPTTTTMAPTTTTAAPTTTTTVAPNTTASNDSFDIGPDGAVTVDIVANDGFDPADGITLQQIGGTAGGTVGFDEATGELVYTPLPSEEGKSVTIEYEVCSGSMCDTAIVTLNIGVDRDNDGILDNIDLDDDNDGVPDAVEVGADPANPVDTDNDGTPDYLDPDSDNDGISDTTEAHNGNPSLDVDGDGVLDTFTDTNDNGLDDRFETSLGGTPLVDPDTNTDGAEDRVDIDSDGDGIPDSVEAGDNPAAPVDTDKDGTPDYLDLDSDNDGIPDAVEAGTDPTKPVDTDKDGTPDFRDLDSDNDGIPDAAEAGTDPTKPVDTDADGTPDFRDLDSDNDGIPDAAEAGDDPTKPVDTDKDGTPDYRTLDADGDGIPDVAEAGPNPQSPVDTDKDGTPDYQDPDSDDDGNPDGSDPHIAVPTATDDTATIPPGKPTVIDLTKNDDFLPSSGITLRKVGGTAAGTAAFDDKTGELTYTPDPSEAGKTVTLQYEVCHDGVCDTAMVTIAVDSTVNPTTTTTAAPGSTTTTAAPGSTTTTAAPGSSTTTAAPRNTTTTAAPASSTSSSSPAGGGQGSSPSTSAPGSLGQAPASNPGKLSFTGSSSLKLVGLGSALLILGLGIVGLQTRRRSNR